MTKDFYVRTKRESIKIALALLLPFFVGWGIIQWVYHSSILPEQTTALVMVIFALAWCVYAGIYGVRLEKKARTVIEQQINNGASMLYNNSTPWSTPWSNPKKKTGDA